jgi:hypothetical protein
MNAPLRFSTLAMAAMLFSTLPATSHAEGGQCNPGDKAAKQNRAGKGKLAQADTNKDGQLSRDEASAAGMNLDRFDRADTNKDGQVTKEELKAARGSKPSKPTN